jgi:putative nucleotidyltransferase with HDIG domain
MSFGVACFPADAKTPNELIHQADVAVYQAKLQGRNRVVCSADVPQAIKLEMPAAQSRLDTGYAETYIPKPAPTPIKVVTPISTPTSSAGETKPVSQKSDTRLWFGLLIGVVIAIALITSLIGFYLHPISDPGIMLLLIVMAGITQLPQVRNLYGETSMSVSVAVNFAAATLFGIPGVALTSAMIVLAHRVFRWDPKKGLWVIIYKTSFNWAVHLLAGIAPAVASTMLPQRWEMSNLLVSIVGMAIAAMVYYLIETSLYTAVVSTEKRISPYSVWKEQFSWLAPQYVVLCLIGFFLAVAYDIQRGVGILVFTVPVLMMYYSQKEYVERTEKGVQELKRMNEELSAANFKVRDANIAFRELNEELLVAFAKMIDARDPFVSGHSAKVADYASAIATDLGLPQEQIAQVRQAGFFHDIGKIGISEQVLHKPARLDKQEYESVKKHAMIGAEFLDTCKGLRYLVPAIKYHHEWWNGGGYPHQLVGEQIPLDARILAVCDAVEAMASDRPYHRAMRLEEIIAEINRCKGTQFDPKVAEAFVRVAEREGPDLVVNSARTVGQRENFQAEPTLENVGEWIAK